MAMRFDDWEGDALQHYGVLGMKWGQRRFQNPDGSLTAAGEKRYAKTGERGYQYHSHATKKYNRKAAKAEAKGNAEKAAKFKRRAERSAELDRREQEAASKAKTGKSILTRMLISPDVTKAYHQFNAMSGGKPGKATKVVNGIMAAYGGTMLSRTFKAAYIRQGEKANGKGVANRLAGNLNRQNEALRKVDKQADKQLRKYR